jgi:hypothetical protein
MGIELVITLRELIAAPPTRQYLTEYLVCLGATATLTFFSESDYNKGRQTQQVYCCLVELYIHVDEVFAR